MFFANATVFQITQLQGLIGIAVFLFGLGAAWATLKMSVKSISDNVEKIEKSLTDMQKSMNSHKADITGLKAHTKYKYGVTNSPTIPNSNGKKLLADSGFNEAYPKLKSKIFALMDTRNPRTLYDYERGAVKALESLKYDPLMDSIKNYIVNQTDAALEDVFMVASWVIRDDYNKAKKVK